MSPDNHHGTLAELHVAQSHISVTVFPPDWARLRTAAAYWAPQGLAMSCRLSICKALAEQLSNPGTLLLWWVSWTHCVSPERAIMLQLQPFVKQSLFWTITLTPLWNTTKRLFLASQKISFINSILLQNSEPYSWLLLRKLCLLTSRTQTSCVS